jgi:hypothetical protein
MEAVAPEPHVAEGYEALGAGDWAAARAAFDSAVIVDESPEALDGLGRALWWLRESEQAVVHRGRAYSGFRRDGQPARAARIALWLSREYALVWGNDAASNEAPLPPVSTTLVPLVRLSRQSGTRWRSD